MSLERFILELVCEAGWSARFEFEEREGRVWELADHVLYVSAYLDETEAP